MAIYKETKDYKLIHDDMLNMGNYIADETIDCVITDPPYELGFMGKKWDDSGIAFNVDAWRKCFNALKDGGYLLAFGGTRTFHRIACAIEDAGFEIRDTIMYIYGTGFPKSMNISKSIEAKEKYGKSNTVTKRVIEQESDGEIYSIKQTNNGAMGEVIETTRKEYQPNSDLAKEWQGWGTALKPAYEPIIVARKPMKTSVAENVIKNGVGGINIDECRVDFVSEEDKGDPYRFQTNNGSGKHGIFNASKDVTSVVGAKGRFPANIIHDGSDEVVSGFPSEAGGGKESGYNFEKINQKNITNIITNIKSGVHYGDSGNASRFFYSAKASKKDRDEGLDAFDESEVRGGGGRVKQGYDDNDEEQQRLKESARKFGAVKSIKKNTHPTVKPIELMQYLVRLVAPKGATILDCFMGSNSTGKAVMFENRERNANYKFIGIELTDEYLPICEARIEYAINKYEYDEKVEQAKTGQLNLFDFKEVE